MPPATLAGHGGSGGGAAGAFTVSSEPLAAIILPCCGMAVFIFSRYDYTAKGAYGLGY